MRVSENFTYFTVGRATASVTNNHFIQVAHYMMTMRQRTSMNKSRTRKLQQSCDAV